MTDPRALRVQLYLLFALSGFAGLIYESIWTQYLKLFLGHAAYAQTLVLAIFMGGMALGAALAARISGRLQHPLLWYAAVEAVLAVAGLLFDSGFRALHAFALEQAIPALDSTIAIEFFKWGASSAAILPQCVLLGATFPLMSAGVVRLYPETSGRVLGWLYATNSFGAAAGVLTSGFVLIRTVGLPGTLLTAGLINVLVALGVWSAVRNRLPARATGPGPGARDARAASPAVVLLAVSFLTGAASFLYEIGWIRMLTLVLGAATHSFELMLSAFIFGLALGSYAVRTRIDGIVNASSALGWIQLTKGALALLTIVLYTWSFDWMAAFMKNVESTDGGYVLFNLFSHGICLALMLPVTVCAGMTLPLITAALLRSGTGERAIGQVYATNTLGAIAGVMVAVHLVMPYLGLRQVIVTGAIVDLGVALWLLRGAKVASRSARVGLGAALGASALIIAFVDFSPIKLASGVFRYGDKHMDKEVLFHRDGKTASISVLTDPDVGDIAISTNGKVDARLQPGSASGDDYTMVLLAALPLVLHPGPQRVAVVGFGSGRTTHVALHDARVERVDTIEIEPVMLEGAAWFGKDVQRAYDDPRSHIHVEDAKTFFARSRSQYDVIVSEPSNPWVSGVASLFSVEYYAQMRRHLRPSGLFVQWLQLYDIDVPLVATVMNALADAFNDYHVYASYDSDLLIVASADGSVPLPDAESLAAIGPGMRALLQHVDVRTPGDLTLRRIGERKVLQPLFSSFGMPANSDYFPVLDQNALRQRFLSAHATGLIDLQPYARRLESGAYRPPDAITHTDSYVHNRKGVQARLAAAYVRNRTGQATDLSGVLEGDVLRLIVALRALREECGLPALASLWEADFASFVQLFGAYLPVDDASAIVRDLRSGRCYTAAPERLRAWVDLFEAVSMEDSGRVQVLATALLAGVPGNESVPKWVAHQLLIADLRLGECESALARLQAWGSRLPHSLARRLLWAHATGGYRCSANTKSTTASAWPN